MCGVFLALLDMHASDSRSLHPRLLCSRVVGIAIDVNCRIGFAGCLGLVKNLFDSQPPPPTRAFQVDQSTGAGSEKGGSDRGKH